MKKKDKKERTPYDDDDGRTVADMSGLRPNPDGMFPVDPEEGEDERPWESTNLTKEERRAYIMGALGAALAIAAVFIAVFGILIWLLLTFWA